jgi:hypothetical protein
MKEENVFDKLIGSLYAKRDGSLSGRKLSAFAGVTMGAYVTIFMLPNAEGGIRLHALYAWLLFALLCLGIVTVQQVIEFKNGGQPKKDEPA